MRNAKFAVAAAAALFAGVQSADAARFFLSTQAFSNPGQLTTGVPLVENPVIEVAPGNVVQLHLWLQTNTGDFISGLGLRYDDTVEGVVTAASYATPQISWPVDPEDPTAGTVTRWNTPINNGQLNSGGFLVRDTNAVGINAGDDPRTGLANNLNDDPTRKTLPAGTVGGLRAFYVATLTLNANAVGTTDIFLESGTATISGAGLAGDLFFGWGDAAVPQDATVPGMRSASYDARITVIPEPASLSLLALGALPMLRRRRA